MISAGWHTAEWELSAAGNFRRRGRVNVRDNTVADRQAVWSLWLLASLIETDALLSWGTLWQMEAEIHRRPGLARWLTSVWSSLLVRGVRCSHLADVTLSWTTGIDWTWDHSDDWWAKFPVSFWTHHTDCPGVFTLWPVSLQSYCYTQNSCRCFTLKAEYNIKHLCRKCCAYLSV